MTEKYWPISLLVALRLPGYPVTRQGWDRLVKRESWPYQDEKYCGRYGERRLYQPPAPVAALIAEHISKPEASAAPNQEDSPTSERQAHLKRQILELIASATPRDQVVKLELTLTIEQAKAVFDALAAMDSGAGDA